jgi:hypothetical protein
VRALLPSFEHLARAAVRRLRARASDIPYFAICLPTWVSARREIAQREVISEEQLRAARRGDRVFIFGSSASLNDINHDEWQRIAEHDTFGFNWFVRENFVRCDFHLIRQIADSNDREIWEPQIVEYFELLERSPHYDSTVLLVQHEWRARGPNLAFQMGVFPRKNRVFPWSTNRSAGLSRAFHAGLNHGSSTLCDSINAAYLMGWSDIVLVGVDLYDRRYFWLPEGETRAVDTMRGAEFDDPHSQATTGLVALIAGWRADLAAEGVSLSVHNPRSLLSSVLPVFRWG